MYIQPLKKENRLVIDDRFRYLLPEITRLSRKRPDDDSQFIAFLIS
jgi:hypothetical protein